MASNLNSTTTIFYKVFGNDKEQEMSIGTQHAAAFAKRMIGQRSWTTATILDAEQNGKLQASMNSALPSNHVDATPHLFMLTAQAKKLETASSKRLVTEAEREGLLLHTLEAVKALGMSVGRVESLVDRVYDVKVSATPVTALPGPSIDPEVSRVFKGEPNVPAPVPAHVPEQKGGLFKR